MVTTRVGHAFEEVWDAPALSGGLLQPQGFLSFRLLSQHSIPLMCPEAALYFPTKHLAVNWPRNFMIKMRKTNARKPHMLTWNFSRSTTRRDHHRIPLVLIEGMRSLHRDSTWSASKGRASRTRPDASDQAISKESEASIVCDYEVQYAEDDTPAISTVPGFNFKNIGL